MFSPLSVVRLNQPVVISIPCATTSLEYFCSQVTNCALLRLNWKAAFHDSRVWRIKGTSYSVRTRVVRARRLARLRSAFVIQHSFLKLSRFSLGTTAALQFLYL